MSLPSEVRVALIGYGYVGKTFHAPLIQAVPGLRLAVVSSRNPEAVRADWPGVEVVGQPEAAVTHSGVELVVIASPNETHFPLAKAALLAGKDVVVDKPFTLTIDEARELSRIAKECGRLISVFQNRRWDGDFLSARALIESGRLGNIVHFESHIDRFRPEVRVRWREQAVPGGGIWYDLGPHLVDQALELFGLPVTVTASIAIQREGGQADDWAHVLLDYGRLQVVLHASMLVAQSGPRFVIHGSRGSWVKSGMDVQEGQLIKGMAPGADGWGVDPEPSLLYEGADASPEKVVISPGDYRKYYQGILEGIQGRAANPVSPIQAIAVMAVLDTAREAAKAGRSLAPALTGDERGEFNQGRGLPGPC